MRRGQTPDIVFQFDHKKALTNNKGGATTRGVEDVAQITQATVWIREDITDQYVLDKNKEAKKPAGGRNGKGWSRNGDTTLDPVLVIMHELTHVMRLDHSPSHPVDTGDFEESIGLGNHREPNIGRSDIIEVQRSDIDRREVGIIKTGTSKGNMSLVTGFTSLGRDRNFIGHDVLAVPQDDAVVLPGTSMARVGATFSSYTSIMAMPNGSELQFLWRTGVIAGIGDSSERVTNVSAVPRFDGTVTGQIDWQVPLLAGLQIPLTELGQTPGSISLEVFGGLNITGRRAGFSGREMGAPAGLGIDASSHWTSYDPAVGVGLQYGLGVVADRLVSAGVSVVVSQTSKHNFSVPSPNFPSQTYFMNTPSQTEVTGLFNISMGIYRASR